MIRRHVSRLLRGAVLALIVAVLFASGPATVRGDAAPVAPKKKSHLPSLPLPPELEAKLKEFLVKAREARIKKLDARMKARIDDIAKVTGRNDDGVKALAAPTAVAIAASADDWTDQLSDMIHAQLSLQPAQSAMMMDQWLGQVSTAADEDYFASGSSGEPSAQESWLKALRQTLTAEQAATWEKTETDRRDAVIKEMADFLKTMTDRLSELRQHEMLSTAKDIEHTLALTQDRADKLETFGKTAAGQSVEQYRNRLVRRVEAMEATQRAVVAKNGNMYLVPDDAEALPQQPAWKDGLAQLLTADETARLQAAADERKAQRVHVLAGIMVSTLDDKLALTSAQRQKLEPVAEQLLKDPLADTMNDGNPAYGMSFPPSMFLALAAKASPADLKLVFDDVQMKRWERLSHFDAAPAPDAKPDPDEADAPEEVERLISNFLYAKADVERKKTFDAYVLKAEDVARVAAVSPETAARLQAASRGAAEEEITRWKFSTEQQVRGQLRDLTPQNVKQRLDSIQDYFFQGVFMNIVNRNGGGDPETIWDKTVKTDLTAKQQEAWQKELDARALYRGQAIALLVVSEFDNRYHLTKDQWGKLQPVITGIIKDYTPDIARVFSPMNPVPWYMETYYVLMPFMGMPEADLKGVLIKDQMDSWTGSDEHANAANLWTSVQQMHDQRVKNK